MSHDAILAHVTDRTMSLAKAILAQHTGHREFRSEDALVDVGLSSLDLVNLMVAVETEFDIMIPPAQLNPKNFYSAFSIARMIVSVKSYEDASAGLDPRQQAAG